MKPLVIGDGFAVQARASVFWERFKKAQGRPKYILGRNIYSERLVKFVPVDGIVDDFSSEQNWQGLPVITSGDIPSNAMVLAASGGQPLTVLSKLNAAGIDCLDYYSLASLRLPGLLDIRFNEGFTEEFNQNHSRFQKVYERLSDDVSRETYRRLVSFRLNYDLSIMDVFKNREREQYFEEFLKPYGDNEIFADVGGFDGFTSLEFIRRCPNYKAIYLFEPDPRNVLICDERLGDYRDVEIYQLGLSGAKGEVSFNLDGSSSGVSTTGVVRIAVDRMEDVVREPPTFIKIDTEGSEMAVLSGAENIIRNQTPKIAVSIYHRPADFWIISEKILQINNRYKLFVRHYTEAIYETVMFFVPE